ncbi:SusE domain-containing protein [Mediterranea massiliensis]|uniref:SusE domain-containing protein n=1 Tax=Mediterranea massiliensis TaxID=1841865 RepID=UPI00266D8919|nr:SusE domain-containing protein [Mediterranea massiliensis]
MKKFNILAGLFLGIGLSLFTACEDDNDSNPIVQQPDTFELNTPALSGNVYDLEKSSYIQLTYKQPDYGYTAAVTYYAQVSMTDKWNDATEESEATYVELNGNSSTCEFGVETSQIDRAIMQLGGYDEETVPKEAVKIYIRLRATLTSGYQCYSNSIALSVFPYYMPVVNAEPEIWYLVGDCIGDGTWGNDGPGNIGVSLIPMSIVDGYEYNATTGQGEIIFTGYFLAGKGFKLIKTPGSWDNQWGNSSAAGIDSPVKNDGGSSNLQVATSGYYSIKLNTATDVLTIEAVEAPDVYHIMMQGDFNGWTDVAMSPVNAVEGMNNHVWKYELDATSGDTTAKFKVGPGEGGSADGWGVNWGGTSFPYGIGSNGGANISIPAGRYNVIFNDINGFYYFYSLD